MYLSHCQFVFDLPICTRPSNLHSTVSFFTFSSHLILFLLPSSLLLCSQLFHSHLIYNHPIVIIINSQMADPLSITAAVVGIIGPALSGIRELLNDLQQFKDAPKTLKRLEDDLGTVNTSLSLLQGLDEKAWKYVGQGATEASSPLIIRCTQACNGFRTDLQKWSRHSVDGKFAAQDRANITFFKQGHIKSMMAQLQDCKLDISVMSNLAVL
jgi:hypothetical protein